MNHFYQQVYAVVKKIPYGKVVSYGKIAAVLGHPRSSREVGRAMRVCPPDNIPWQRVVMADGTIAGGGCGEKRKALLEEEGVEFLPNGRVNMERCCIEQLELELIALIVGGEVQEDEIH
ncbi:MAG: MGMT family protein [Firmicutes bacterium]|nr:MGMT family protein [Bacillota bacterium]